MARASMRHRAIIERNAEQGVDPDGHPLPAIWEPYLTLACRAYTKVRKEVIDGDKTAQIEDIKALFSLNDNDDLSEDYRITNITDRQGAVLFSGPLDIISVQRRSNHFEASLDRIQS